jgi:hypothetical protein
MKKTILLILLAVCGSSSFAQMQQGTHFVSLNISPLWFVPQYEQTFLYDREPVTNATGDTIPLLSPPNGGFRYQYAWTPNWSSGVMVVSSGRYFAGGLFGRYYFDLSRERDYPAFFVHVGTSFHSRVDDLGRVNHGGAEVLLGQTFRSTREPLTYGEILQDYGEFFRSAKWPRNAHRGRWGLEYAFGAGAAYGPPSRKSVISPTLQLGVLYYFDAKGWSKGR